MLLAEALAARKDALAEIDRLRERLVAATVRYEDQESVSDQPDAIVTRLAEELDRFESLSVRINRTNNAVRLNFSGRELTIMEAVAYRARLTLEAKARRGAVDAIEQATSARGRRGWPGLRRTKDDLREVPTVDLADERGAADELSQTVRRLDMALQQQNWTSELLE
jgi:hypothetical protein